jgi:small basic protein
VKILLIITAVFEGVVGLGLLLVPDLVGTTLMNTQLDTPGGLIAGRIAGAAILSLAICCWKAYGFALREAALEILTAVLFYNFAAAAVLVYGGTQLGLQSTLIWPAIVVHGVLGLWCAALIWRTVVKQHRAQSTEKSS